MEKKKEAYNILKGDEGRKEFCEHQMCRNILFFVMPYANQV